MAHRVILFRKLLSDEFHPLKDEINEDGQEWKDVAWSLPIWVSDVDNHPESKEKDEKKFFPPACPGADQKENDECIVQISPACTFSEKRGICVEISDYHLLDCFHAKTSILREIGATAAGEQDRIGNP